MESAATQGKKFNEIISKNYMKVGPFLRCCCKLKSSPRAGRCCFRLIARPAIILIVFVTRSFSAGSPSSINCFSPSNMVGSRSSSSGSKLTLNKGAKNVLVMYDSSGLNKNSLA